MKLWFAEVVEVGCEFLCILLGHFHGCWLLNSTRSPLSRLHWWAVLLRWNDFRRHKQWECEPEESETVTVSTATSNVFTVNGLKAS